MNTEGTDFYTYKECHTTEYLSKHTTISNKEREQSGDRRNVGESSCNSGDGTGQMAQPLMFMMMIMINFPMPLLKLRKNIVVPFGKYPRRTIFQRSGQTVGSYFFI